MTGEERTVGNMLSMDADERAYLVAVSEGESVLQITDTRGLISTIFSAHNHWQVRP